MADIEIAIRAKNEASAAFNQASTDLTNLASAATDTTASLNNLTVKPLTITATDDVTPVIDRVQASVSAASDLNAVTPIEISAIDNATPVLQDVQQRVEGGDFEIAPLDITATDNATPVLQEVRSKTDALSQNVEPIELEVTDDWRAPIDELNARLAETKANAADVSQQLNKLESPKAVNLTAKDNATPKVNGLRDALGGLDGAAGKVASGLGGLDSALALGGAALGINGVVQLTQALFELGEAGASFTELKDASAGLGEAFGVNAQQMLYAMRQAAEGTISDSSLMLAANKAIVTGVTTNASTMATLLGEAKARADAFGLSSTQAFDTLVSGISNASPRMLKQLGYTIDLTQATEDYAKSIGVASDKLNEQQQRAAILQAVLAQSGKIPGGASQADDFEHLAVSIDKVRIAFGVLVAANFGDGIGFIAEKVDELAESLRDLPNGLEQSFSTAQIQLNEWQQKLGAAQQQNAGVSDFLFGTKTAGTFGPAIEAAQQQIDAFTQLQNTVQLADQAIQAGIPGAQGYAEEINAIAAAAQNNGSLTSTQVAALQSLNIELQNGIRGMGGAASAEAGLGGAIAATNPVIDEQAAKLKKLWDTAGGTEGLQRSGPALQALAQQITQMGYAEFQASEGARNLASGLDFAGKIAVAASGDIDEVNAALRRLKGQAAIKATFDGARSSALSQAKSVVQQAVDSGRLSAEKGAAAYNNLAIQINSINDPLSTDIVTMFRFENQLGAVIDGTEQANQAFDEQNAAAQRLAEEGLQQVQEQYDNIRDKVASVISDAQSLPSFKAGDLFNADELTAKGLSFDAQISVDQAANGGISPDAINENAKRLMAIAKEGFKDQSWLDEFKREVPEVFAELADSPDIRGTALRILQQFQDGLRPELLDKSLIKDRVKAMIIGDQNAAALAEEIAQEIAGELGISLQQAMAATNTTLGLGAGTGEGDAGAAVQAPDLTEAGTTTGESFSAGIIAGFNTAGMTGQIVAKIDAEFSNPKNIDALKKSGGTVGAVWGTGFLNTVGANIPPGLYDVLVSGLVPLIVASLAGQGSRTGAQP